MGDLLETLKTDLERFGEANDAATYERPRLMLNITGIDDSVTIALLRELGTTGSCATVAIQFIEPPDT